MRRQCRTLYLCYFGLHEPLVQTQVLPYLRELSREGIEVSLLTFEPNYRSITVQDAQKWRAALAEAGIDWSYLPYHKRPSLAATACDIYAGARFILRAIRERKIDVLHARSHVPLAMALVAQRFGATCRLIFDIRGLMAEEYRDAGIWRENSLAYRAVKRVEAEGIQKADQLVVLTTRFRDWLVAQKMKPAEQIEVIPCCVDLNTAAPKDKTEFTSPSDRFEVIYAGSVTGLYLLEEMGRFFGAIKAQRPGAFFRILSVSPVAGAVTALKRAGLQENDFEITAVPPEKVPEYLSQARLGISFRKPTFAQIAASPTKIPEYLAAGLPVVCNAGIGDMDELVEREQVGVVLRSFDETAYQRGAAEALLLAEVTELRERAMRVAHQYFDLTAIGGRRYVNVYKRLAETTG